MLRGNMATRDRGVVMIKEDKRAEIIWTDSLSKLIVAVLIVVQTDTQPLSNVIGFANWCIIAFFCLCWWADSLRDGQYLETSGEFWGWGWGSCKEPHLL